MFYKLIEVFKTKRVILLLGVMALSLGGLFVAETSAQVDMDCYRRKIFDPDLECEFYIDNCDEFNDIDRVFQDEIRQDCISDGLHQWNRATCQCEFVDSDNPIYQLKQVLFFKTNYDGTIDNVSEFIRMGFILFFAVMAVAALFLGIYGMYLYTTAGEDDEKIQKAQKIFKNALIGLAIAVFGIVIVQVVAVFMGIQTEDLFTFRIS